MKRTRIPSILASLALVVGVFAGSHITAGIAVASPPTNGECDHGIVGNYFGGFEKTAPGGKWATGVEAEIYVDPARFQLCTGAWPTDAQNASQWVSLGLNPPYDIVQVGVLRCAKDGYTQADSPCYSHPGEFRYFYAWGRNSADSCGWGGRAPRAQDLGPADSTAEYHDFAVWYEPDLDRVYFEIDHAVVKTVSGVSMCWLNSPNVRVQWYGETWDPSDGLGGPGPARFQSFRYESNSNGVWTGISWPDCSWSYLDPEFYCSKFSTTNYGIYTKHP